jgi:hypothetical protein
MRRSGNVFEALRPPCQQGYELPLPQPNGGDFGGSRPLAAGATGLRCGGHLKPATGARVPRLPRSGGGFLL